MGEEEEKKKTKEEEEKQKRKNGIFLLCLLPSGVSVHLSQLAYLSVSIRGRHVIMTSFVECFDFCFPSPPSSGIIPPFFDLRTFTHYVLCLPLSDMSIVVQYYLHHLLIVRCVL